MKSHSIPICFVLLLHVFKKVKDEKVITTLMVDVVSIRLSNE